MPKASRDALGAEGKRDAPMFDPDKLVLVTDQNSALYDERVNWPVDEALVANILFDPDGDGVPQGVLEPVIVRRNAETGAVEVAAGRRRVKAAREANKRLRKQGREPIRVPALVIRARDARAMAVMISENEHRANDTPLGRALKAQRYVNLGRDESEVATLLGVSATTVRNMLRLLDAPAAVRNAVDSGKVSVGDGYKLSRLEPGEAKSKLAELVEKAPRTPGKKRSENTKKAREIMGGGALPTSDPATDPAAPIAGGADVASREARKVERDIRRLEDATAEFIAGWIEKNWNESDWSGSLKEIPNRIRSGDWREQKG